MLSQISKQCRRTVNLCKREFGNLSFKQLQHDTKCSGKISLHASQLPPLSKQDQALVNTLRREGVVVTSLRELELSNAADFLNAANSVKGILSAKKTNLVNQKKDGFLLTAPSSLVASYPILFRWGLQERLLNLAEHYQQLPVAYHGVYLRRDYARPVVSRSRLWHTDMEDDHTLKIIVYLHDVDEKGGPFEYIPKKINQKVLNQLGVKCGYIRPGQVEKLVSPGEWKSCVGAAGTVIIVDTGSLIHRGKLPQRDRYTVFFDYTSRLPRRPYYCKSSLEPKDLFAVTQGLSQKQLESVFWRCSGENDSRYILEDRETRPWMINKLEI